MNTGEVIALIKAFGGSGGGSSGGGVLVVHVDETYTLDKTWQEINDALSVGQMAVFSMAASGYVFSCRIICTVEATHEVQAVMEQIEDYAISQDVFTFAASSASDYPVIKEQ